MCSSIAIRTPDSARPVTQRCFGGDVSKRRPNAAGGCRTPGQFVRIRCPSWCASFWSAAVPCRFLAVANCGTVDVQCGGSWKAFLRPGPRQNRGCEAYIEGQVLELGSKAGRKELDAQWRELRRGSGSRAGGRNGGRSSWPGWVRVLNILKSEATCKDYRTDPFNVTPLMCPQPFNENPRGTRSAPRRLR